VTATHQSIALPEVRDVGEGARALVYLSTIVGGAWAVWVRWRKRRKLAEERRAADAHALRQTVDALHHLLRAVNGGELMAPDELRRQEFLVRRERRRLAQVDGHLELLAEADAEDEREARRWATRTQRLQARKDEIRASKGDQGR
jgi:uncharacterized iron-regulated membrane protein